MSLLLALLLIIGIFIALLESAHRLRLTSPLELKVINWESTKNISSEKITIEISINNPNPKIEVMVPKIRAKATLIGNNVDNIETNTKILSVDNDNIKFSKYYWQSTIIKKGYHKNLNIEITLASETLKEITNNLETIWLEIIWNNYGPFGIIKRKNGIAIPVKKQLLNISSKLKVIKTERCEIIPIKTHLLGCLDDPLEVLTNYTSNILKTGDILTIGETPLAIMQGRYKDPIETKPGWLALSLCRAFHPTSSLATACGFQTLINLVGPSRLIIAWLGGVGFKLVGVNGMFYRLAGEQARLIDDITGTTPPYDKSIVLGPINTQRNCEELSTSLGTNIAIVDVNDLGRVKILAASKNTDKDLLKQALSLNPAGNSNQQTPLVIVRPS